MVISLNGPVVQLVELWIVDPSVAGSNPVWSAEKLKRLQSNDFEGVFLFEIFSQDSLLIILNYDNQVIGGIEAL